MFANLMRQLSLPLSIDEASLYHDAGKHGFFAILTRAPDAPTRQASYRLDAMPTVLDRLPLDRDSWISQAEFVRPNRRVVNLARIGLLFADLDTYKVEALRGRSPDELVAAMRFPRFFVFKGSVLMRPVFLSAER